MRLFVHHSAGEIDYGPGPLPVSWGLVSGLLALSDDELRAIGWLPVIEDVQALGPWQRHGAPGLVLNETHALLTTPAVAMSEDEVVRSIVTAVQAHMDAVAQSMGYDDIKTAVTYADEPAVPRFQAEGQALRAWRSLVWAACYSGLDDIRAGHASMPESADAVIAALPPPPQLGEVVSP